MQHKCVGQYIVFGLIIFSCLNSLKLLSCITNRTNNSSNQSLPAPFCSCQVRVSAVPGKGPVWWSPDGWLWLSIPEEENVVEVQVNSITKSHVKEGNKKTRMEAITELVLAGQKLRKKKWGKGIKSWEKKKKESRVGGLAQVLKISQFQWVMEANTSLLTHKPSVTSKHFSSAFFRVLKKLMPSFILVFPFYCVNNWYILINSVWTCLQKLCMF